MANTEKMSDAALKAKREYQKQWRKKHPEAARKHVAAYWERKAKEEAEREAEAEAGEAHKEAASENDN